MNHTKIRKAGGTRICCWRMGCNNPSRFEVKENVGIRGSEVVTYYSCHEHYKKLLDIVNNSRQVISHRPIR